MKKLSVLFLFTILTSCLEELKLPEIKAASRLIIEGSFGNKGLFLRITQTDKVGNYKRIIPATGIFVELVDDKEQRFRLRPDPLGTGIYTLQNGFFAPLEGVGYKLAVKLENGGVYETAFQKMSGQVQIDNLKYDIVETPSPGYAISAEFKDPANSQNYYRWKAQGYHLRKTTGVLVGRGDNRCCTTCYVKSINQTLNILSDQSINGGLVKNQSVFFSPYYGEGKRYISIDQYSISKAAFDYYTKLGNQINRTGSIFDPLPASVAGNLVNVNDPNDKALGFFEVHYVSKKQVLINSTDLQKFEAFYQSPSFVLEGDCLLRYPYSLYFDGKDPLF